MKYLSVCSGIEAASVAWHHLGWEPVGFSEIEPFPAAVLAHRFPSVPNFGDMTKYEQWPIQPGSIDVLVGGTPCQSFSVAGLRKGLEDPRGNLMLTYLAIAARLRPRWIVWENVPGVLSSNGGRDFGTFLGALGELRYGFAYRVLDAQYVRVGRWPRAVPQRRRRVFVVGRLLERGTGDGAAAAEVLALREGLQRHLEASGKARKGAASDAESGARGGCYWNGEQVAAALTRKGCDDRMPDKERLFAVLQTIGATDVSDSLVARNNQTTGFQTDVVATPTAFRWQNERDGLQQDDAHAVAHAFYSTGGTHGVNQHPEVSPAVKVGSGLGIPSPPAVAHAMTVRRLTARECERLQGFPDDWTLIPWRKKPAEECPDGPRYKALGNSMACNCMAWIGERIAAYEQRGRVDPTPAGTAGIAPAGDLNHEGDRHG